MGKVNPNTIVGQFVAHRKEMMESPGWGSLSLAARRVLDRLEIEHMGHGGAENGNLPCTYDDFENFGIRRKSITEAITELVDGGFVVVVQRGRGGKFVSRPTASRYRLTYLATPKAAPTDDWKNRIPVAKAPLAPVAKTPPVKPSTSGENAPTGPVAKTPLLSISRRNPHTAPADDVAPPNPTGGRVNGDGQAGGSISIGEASLGVVLRLRAAGAT